MGRHLNADATADDEAADAGSAHDEHGARHVVEAEGKPHRPADRPLEQQPETTRDADAADAVSPLK